MVESSGGGAENADGDGVRLRELRGKCSLPSLILPPRSLPDILLRFDGTRKMTTLE